MKALSIDYNLVCYFDLDTGNGRLLRDDETEHSFETFFRGDISLEESMGAYIEKSVHEEDKEMVRQESSRERIRQELGEAAALCELPDCHGGRHKVFSGEGRAGRRVGGGLRHCPGLPQCG